MGTPNANPGPWIGWRRQYGNTGNRQWAAVAGGETEEGCRERLMAYLSAETNNGLHYYGQWAVTEGPPDPSGRGSSVHIGVYGRQPTVSARSDAREGRRQ